MGLQRQLVAQKSGRSNAQHHRRGRVSFLFCRGEVYHRLGLAEYAGYNTRTKKLYQVLKIDVEYNNPVAPRGCWTPRKTSREVPLLLNPVRWCPVIAAFHAKHRVESRD